MYGYIDRNNTSSRFTLSFDVWYADDVVGTLVEIRIGAYRFCLQFDNRRTVAT